MPKSDKQNIFCLFDLLLQSFFLSSEMIILVSRQINSKKHNKNVNPEIDDVTFYMNNEKLQTLNLETDITAPLYVCLKYEL